MIGYRTEHRPRPARPAPAGGRPHARRTPYLGRGGAQPLGLLPLPHYLRTLTVKPAHHVGPLWTLGEKALPMPTMKSVDSVRPPSSTKIATASLGFEQFGLGRTVPRLWSGTCAEQL